MQNQVGCALSFYVVVPASLPDACQNPSVLEWLGCGFTACFGEAKCRRRWETYPRVGSLSTHYLPERVARRSGISTFPSDFDSSVGFRACTVPYRARILPGCPFRILIYGEFRANAAAAFV